MANTYTQLYVHIVFSVKGRQALIPECHKTELHKYITGILTHKKQKLIQINSMPDHIHILAGVTPDTALSGLVKDIKVNSTRFINQKRWTVGQFAWQAGFGRLVIPILRYPRSLHILKIRRSIINLEVGVVCV